MARGRQMQFDDSFFERLARSPEVTNLCVEKATMVAAAAKAAAPVDTGTYRDSIHVEVQPRRRRNAAVVVASDRKALLIESDTGNLARALRAARRG